MTHARSLATKRLPGDRERATTNEMRFDWLADRWVIIAPQRTSRPDDFFHQPLKLQTPENCPFCMGKEYETPDAVASYRICKSGQQSPWRVRVVPNKFPAVNAMLDGFGVAELDRIQPTSERINLFERRELFGAHEVIIESPKHIQSITALDSESTDLVFQAYRDRLKHWLDDRNCVYAVIFKNVGKDAGASIAHTHSQLIATDVLPNDIQRTSDRMRMFHEKEHECIHCRMVCDEIENESRLVEETPDFLAFCPFASRVPSLVTIVPKTHQSRFEMLDPFAIKQVSWLTHRLIRRIEKCYPEAAYNFVIHTAPKCLQESDFFHWRLELFPRLTKVAGFEWGSDCFINPLAPEDAARNLRSAGV